MAFKDFVRGQFIDVIEFVDDTKKLLVHKFTRYNDEIKQGARLIVRNGQAAVFVHRGQIADVFGPGHYELNTGNLPIISSLGAFPSFFNSPIKSDVYFINTTFFINNRWGTKNPVIRRDPELGMVRFTAFGTYAFKIVDIRKFMLEVFGARKLSMTYDIIQYLSSFVGESVAQDISEDEHSVLDFAAHYRELAEKITPNVNKKAEVMGVSVSSLTIENISLPEEVEKLIDEQSGIGLAQRNMDSFVQYQTIRALRDASKQEQGLAGLGAGLAFANKLTDAASAPAESSEDTVEQLLKYKGLLDQGIITQEEFDELKKRLLELN